jgi:hypothetical protein
VTTVSPAGEAELARWLSALRPRDCGYRRCEVADADTAVRVLASLPVAARLLAGVVAGPTLRAAVLASLPAGPAAPALVDYLRDAFPPEREVPALAAPWLPPLRVIALGGPGQPVEHGLFPATCTKLARLALARSGDYPADVVMTAARAAYGPDRGTDRGSYHAHDALGCALVHPGVDAAALALEYGRHTARQRGHRSRRKTHQLLAWARRAGYLADDELSRPSTSVSVTT